ncbi:uncharacterized protein UV8b_05744 [Ustilaginoidea virens]|uniref:Uncharacterized protein n=1 Tax=Ustilaginoidea virens TaxID=1159556 RepID=A0A8E5MJ66_USTVR|nr:uncharacterized protein UV8b_05744 [Ustilaginoidea virens]QUC21501.1 hypothetical protein UV8b_05744 [Ustilaginoidea virens]
MHLYTQTQHLYNISETVAIKSHQQTDVTAATAEPHYHTPATTHVRTTRTNLHIYTGESPQDSGLKTAGLRNSQHSQRGGRISRSNRAQRASSDYDPHSERLPGNSDTGDRLAAKEKGRIVGILHNDFPLDDSIKAVLRQYYDNGIRLWQV